MLYKEILTFECVNETRKCDNSYESFWVILSCGIVYYAVVLTFESFQKVEFDRPGERSPE